jgi:FAD:protein FMN transferase
LKQTRLIMGMPVTLEVVDPAAGQEVLDEVFAYFTCIDEKFSTYKYESEISRINRRELTPEQASLEMRTVFALAEGMRKQTHGYFDNLQGGFIDPSGLVKGWAIQNAAEMIRRRGFENFYVEAGGDIQAAGKNAEGLPWRVGIRSPFAMDQIVKLLSISERGVATSGTYIRGQHIYNPKTHGTLVTDVVSLTVIGPDIYQADCFATAAFAMGRKGILFIERQKGFEGYSIDRDGIATFTRGFEQYVSHDESSR